MENTTEYLLGVSGGRGELTVVVDRSIIGGEEGVGSVLSGGSFEGACDVNLEGVRHVEGDTLGVS